MLDGKPCLVAEFTLSPNPCVMHNYNESVVFVNNTPVNMI